MEFLVDTGMELARHIIFKVVDLIMEHSAAGVASVAKRNAQKVRETLEPQLDKIQAQIRDLAESVYKTALDHLFHALIILKERYDELDLPADQRDSTFLIGLRRDTAIPQSALDLLRDSYDKAITAFNSAGNLPPERRIRAMQIAVLCIGIQHVQEPKVVLGRWKMCISRVFQDEAISKCIEQSLEMSRFRKFFTGHKAEDLQAFVIFGRDVLSQIARIASRDETDRDTIKEAVNEIVAPDELDRDVREKWSEKLNWKSYANFIKFRDELKFKQAGAAFDACAALPDGGIVVALGNDAVIQYSRDFEKINFKAGAYYSLAYDINRQLIWGFSKRKQALVALAMDTLEPTGTEIPAPTVVSKVRVARWHMAITESGKIVLAAQFLRPEDAKANAHILFAKNTLDDDWMPLKMEEFIPRSKVTDISAIDVDHPRANCMIALAVEGSIHLLEALVSSNLEPDSHPEVLVQDIEHLLPDELQDNMSCTFDDQGYLIVIVRRQTINIINPKKKELIKKDFALRASGNWVASGQRALWTPTLTGDITQYEYFIM